jgi:hypothetical protein
VQLLIDIASICGAKVPIYFMSFKVTYIK